MEFGEGNAMKQTSAKKRMSARHSAKESSEKEFYRKRPFSEDDRAIL